MQRRHAANVAGVALSAAPISSAPKPSQRHARGLLTWDDLHQWQRDNAYIRTHYRPASFSLRGSLASLFYLHNESVNIHSHLLGAAVFLLLPLGLYLSSGPPAPLSHMPHPSPWTSADTCAFACFFGGAVVCLATSGIFHCISNHSPGVARIGNQLDYVGIVALITGSFVPSVYYGFYCEPRLYRVYWAMICTLGLVCTAASVMPKFRTPQWRPMRTAVFVGMGLSAVFPVIHGLKRFGYAGMEERIGLRWLTLHGMLYILGAFIYAARFPERWRPGKFDVWGSSHQIFHVLVLLAACAHLTGLLKAGEYAHRAGRCELVWA